MKRVYILRGLPGAGKSTVAGMLAFSRDFHKLPGDRLAVVCSADEYFIQSDGSYNWQAVLLPTAHEACFEKFCRALYASVDTIIVDNVNYRRAHFVRYIEQARKFNYEVTEITVGDLDVDRSVTNNTHGVPRETIERMVERWER